MRLPLYSQGCKNTQIFIVYLYKGTVEDIVHYVPGPGRPLFLNSQLFLCSLTSGAELISPVAKRILRAKSMLITSKHTGVRQGRQTHFDSVYFFFLVFFSPFCD